MLFLIIFTLTSAQIYFDLIRTKFIMEYPILDRHQTEYTIDLQFGEKKKRFDLIIDTGSSDLWIPSKNSKGFDHQIHKYDCQKSYYCKETQDHHSIYYDDGPIHGVLAWDQVWLGDRSFNQSFLLVKWASGHMTSCNGILGLGFKQIRSDPNPSILESLYQQHLINSMMFSLYLNNKGKHGSKIIFGDIDKQYIRKSEQLLYVPLVDDGTYKIQLLGVKIGDVLLNVNYAVVDSGTSCLTFPQTVIDNLIAELQNYNIQCLYRVETYAPSFCMANCIVNAVDEQQIIQQFPVIKIALTETQELALYPKDYIFKCVKISDTQSKCFTKLERSQIDDQLLMGDAFLQSFYTVFDQTNKQLGFAHSINDGVDLLLVDDEIYDTNSSYGILIVISLLFI